MRQAGLFIFQQLALCSVLFVAVGCWEADAAVALSGTFGFTPIGTITYSGANLGLADSVTLPATEVVNTVPATYNGVANFFYAGASAIPLLSHLAVNPSTLSLPTVWGSFTPSSYLNFLVISDGTSPNNRYNFSLLDLMKTSNGSSDLEVYGQGMLHDTLGVFADTPGLLSIAFTQTGPTGAVNASFSVATSIVPEPGTLVAGCFALGWVLIGFFAYGRNSAGFRK
jgi:hypothetical protein